MSDSLSAQNLLTQGLKAFDLDLECAKPLLAYLKELQRWNQAYNLTAIRDLPSMISKHLFDSLSILPWLHGTNILDVGTGAGLPGIPLALARPHIHFVLLDSNGKKTRFLQEMKRQLNIKNIEIVQTRVEHYQASTAFDTLITRAVGSLSQLIQWTQHLIAKDGIWLAMKGQEPEQELIEIAQPYEIKHYSVEGVIGQRCCILINNLRKE